MTARLSTHRAGFSMIELLLVLVLGMMLLVAAFRTMSQQEQAYGLFNAMAATQGDTRVGMELLTAELREVSANGTDLLMATPDSLRIRALRKFGIICQINNAATTQLIVAQQGVDLFAQNDSLVVYVDQDSLQAADDIWLRAYANNAGSAGSCTGDLGASLADLMPDATLRSIGVGGALPANMIFPGAPIRSFETLTYRVGTWQGEDVLERVSSGGVTPLLGPLTETDGFVVSYFDTTGTQLTTFPLSAADRGSVERLRIELRAERRAGTQNRTHMDSLITEIYLRGS